MPQYPTWRGIAATKKYTLTTKNTKIHEKRQIQLHHEGHEGSEGKPGSAGRRTGFMHFAFGDQSRDCGTVGSRPAGRRWHVMGNNILFAGPALRGGQFLLTFVNAKAWA
jgi:hypothetical protein